MTNGEIVIRHFNHSIVLSALGHPSSTIGTIGNCSLINGVLSFLF